MVDGSFMPNGHGRPFSADQARLTSTNASTVQPFAYLQLVFASTIGILVFGDSLDPMLIVGSAVIVGSGLFALQRERKAVT